MKSKLLLLSLIFLALFPSFSRVYAETISVTAIVPPRLTDFQLLLETQNPPSTIAPNAVIPFKITYGVKPSAGINVPTKLTADWKGIAASDGTRMGDYVQGSATTAYANTMPVVDILNRTLIWDMPSLPPGTLNNQVTFTVMINSNYLKSDTIPWNVVATMSDNYVTLPQQVISYTSSYTPPVSTTTQTTQSTTQSSVTTSTSSQQIESPRQATTLPTTSTPRLGKNPVPIPVSDNKPQISFTMISKSGVKLITSGKKLKTIIIKYGKSPKALSQTRTITPVSEQEQIELENLLSATAYYFQITTIDQQNQAATSDIMTFKTAQTSTPPNLEKNVSVITSNGNVLLSDVKDKSGNKIPIALVQTNTPYEITYTLHNKIALKSIETIVRSKVLGENTFTNVLGIQELVIPMTEKEPGVYIANLKSLQPGTFEIFVRVIDIKGNLTEEKIAEAKVMPRLTVYDQTTNKPIADTRVYFYRFNPRTRTYQPLLSDKKKNIANPSYTDTNGEIDITIPPAKYRITVSGLGYEEKTVDFSLGPNPGEEFPQIYLKKDLFNIGYILRHFKNSTIDLLGQTHTFFTFLSVSIRFFNLIAVATVLVSVLLSFLFFSLRTHIHLLHLFPFFTHHTQKLLKIANPSYAPLLIVNDDSEPISRATVACINIKTGKLEKQYKTNKAGMCYLPSKNDFNKLLITKEGYIPVALPFDRVKYSQKPIILTKNTKPIRSFVPFCIEVLEKVGGMLFECTLLFSLVAESFFLSLFGFEKTLPFFILSFFNIVLWIFYLRQRGQ